MLFAVSDVVWQAIIGGVVTVALALIAIWKEAHDRKRTEKLKTDITATVAQHSEAVVAEVKAIVKDRPGSGSHSQIMPG